MIFDTHPYQREQYNMTSANNFNGFVNNTTGNTSFMNHNHVSSFPSFPPPPSSSSSPFVLEDKKPSIQFTYSSTDAADVEKTTTPSPFTNGYNNILLQSNKKHTNKENSTEPSIPPPPPKKRRRTMNDAFRNLSLQQQQYQQQQVQTQEQQPSFEILDDDGEVISEYSDNNSSPIDRDDEIRRKLHYKLSSASSSSSTSLSSLASTSDCSIASSSLSLPNNNSTPTSSTKAIIKYQSSNPVDDKIEDIIRQYRIKAYIQNEIQRRGGSGGRFLLKQEAENSNDDNGMEVTEEDEVDIEEIADDDDNDDDDEMFSMET